MVICFPVFRTFSLIVVFTAGLSKTAFAADAAHTHGAMKSPDARAQAELGAQAAFDAHGTLWTVHKVSGHIAVSRSDDRGQTWSNPVLVTRAPELTDTGGDARPKIVLGREGEVYLTWTKPLAQPYAGEIRFARSLDGGRSFSEPIVVNHDGREITHRFDTLTVNRDGKVFVAWIDKRDLVDAGNDQKKYRGAAVYFAVSDDRGANFRGDFKVADHACECCRIALLARGDGSVSAMWRHIFEPNIRDHATAVLFPDGKVGPMHRASFEGWRIDACPHHGPAAAADASGQLHAVWFSGAPNSRGFVYGRLRDGSVDGLRRFGSETAGHGDVAVGGHQVAVVWKDYADGQSRLLRAISDDDGHTWREAVVASVTGPSDHPRLLSLSGHFYVFWNTQEKPLLTTKLQ